MIRVGIACLVTVALMGGSFAGRLLPAAGAQETFDGHPLVGTWLFTNECEEPDHLLVQFGADGTALRTELEGSVLVGTWEPDGDDEADVSWFSLGQIGLDRELVTEILVLDGRLERESRTTWSLTYWPTAYTTDGEVSQVFDLPGCSGGDGGNPLKGLLTRLDTEWPG